MYIRLMAQALDRADLEGLTAHAVTHVCVQEAEELARLGFLLRSGRWARLD